MKLFLHLIPFHFSIFFGEKNLAVAGWWTCVYYNNHLVRYSPSISIYSSTGARHLIWLTTRFSALISSTVRLNYYRGPQTCLKIYRRSSKTMWKFQANPTIWWPTNKDPNSCWFPVSQLIFSLFCVSWFSLTRSL